MTIESLLQELLQEVKEIRSFMIKGKEAVLMENGKRFLTLKEWTKHHSYPSEHGMRALIFNEKQYGITFVKRVGRRVLIDEKEFFSWIENNPKFKTSVHHESLKRYSTR